MIDTVRFQVDIVAGDANKASYSCKKKQSVPNQMESSFHIMLKATSDFLRGFEPGWPNTMGYSFVTANSQANLIALDSYFAKEDRDYNDQPDTDCIVACVL